MNRDRRYPFLILFAIIMACLALFFAVKFAEALIARAEAPKTNYEEYLQIKEDREWSRTVKIDGQKYRRKDKQTVLLLLGVDNVIATSQQGTIGTGGRSDAIMLLVMDDVAKTIKTLTVPRDTQVLVEVYNDGGYFMYAAQMHITLQYAFGDSPLRSCYLTKKVVGDLLHGVYIDGTLSVTMDAIATVVDAIGGLRLTFDQDYSYIDPAYRKGVTLTLDGNAAESFIRYRDSDELGSAEKRAAKLEWLVGELFKNLRGMGGSTFVDDLIDKAGDHVYSNISAEDLLKISSYTYTGENYTIPGETKEGAYHDEYIYNEEALQKLILDLFYDPASN